MLQFPSTVVAPKRASISPPAVSCLSSSSSSSHSSSLSFASSPSLHHLSLSRLPKSAQSYPKLKKRIKVINEQTQPLKVMISGAPASGKGTQCELIVKKFGLVHISTGDLLRAEVSAGTDIGNKAKEYMNAGRLVPDEIVNAMVTTRLSLQDVKEKGWLLDGYPRSFVQAQSLESLNVKPDIYIVLNVPDEILIDRCVGRRLDPVTGKIYHIKNFLPEDEEVKGRLITRADDTEEKVKSRLEIYKQNVESILVMYKDIMKKVDGNRSKEVVFNEVESLLSQFVKEKAVASEKQLKKSLPKQENWRGIPTRLNNIPHTREIREYFYADVLQATQKAISAGKTRLRVDITIPELNPEMDVYRIGTLMELIRVIALSYADDGKRVKVCVQGSMGEGALIGMPLQLAGTRKILEFMDWGDYGAIGTFINIGSIGANDVGEEDDIFILVAPQNAVGNCIIEDLRAMTNSAGIRPVILINPRLKDLPGSSGIMQTMGRDKRLEYAASFENCYHFRLLYYAGTQYPIMGALRMAYPNGYQLYKRVDDEQEAAAGREKEKYILLSTFEQRPDRDEINDAFDGRKRNQDKKTSGFWSFFSDVLG